MRREQVFWGWGEPGAGPTLPEHAVRVPARGARRSTAASCRAAGGAGRRAAARAGARPPRCAAAGGHRRRRRGPRRPRGARAALPRQVLPRPAGAACGRLRGRARRGRRARPATTRRWRCCRRAPRRASRSCRSAAARAWSAGWSPTRGPFDALVSLDLGAHGPAAQRRRALARPRVLEPGHAAARGRPRARRARPHARPLAAELRVGDGRRLRGDALGRPGVDGLRAHRREPRRRAAVATPLGELATLEVPATRRRAVAARARGRLGGRARRDHARSRCACGRCPRRSALRGLVRAGLRATAARPAPARAGRRGARRRAAVGRGRDALSRSRWPARARSPARRSARACAARRGCLLVVRLGGHRGRRRRAGGGTPRGSCAARARRSCGSGPGAHGRRRASPARTCATTCSTAA